MWAPPPHLLSYDGLRPPPPHPAWVVEHDCASLIQRWWRRNALKRLVRYRILLRMGRAPGHPEVRKGGEAARS